MLNSINRVFIEKGKIHGFESHKTLFTTYNYKYK